LITTTSHPTSEEIFGSLKEEFPSMSLATVYNTLDALVGLGLVNALGSVGDNKVHFDGNTDPHINLACVRCHQIKDVTSTFVEKINSEVAGNSGFKVLGSRMLYYGVCPDCQKKESQFGEKSN
jgi:Fur family peroxide stress response transcriptional regulator